MHLKVGSFTLILPLLFGGRVDFGATFATRGITITARVDAGLFQVERFVVVQDIIGGSYDH